jgi:hypothetical protein
MPTLSEIRKNYPQYNDLSDEQLTDSLYKKYYSDIPRAQFDQKMLMNEATGKRDRFLQNFTVQGPVSGVMGLIRSAGQAAQGQRPDLLTNPEGAIPEAVQGSVVAGTGARAAGRLPIERAMPERIYPQPSEPPSAPTSAPRQLEYRPYEATPEGMAEKLATARDQAAQMQATEHPIVEPSGPAIAPPARYGQVPPQPIPESAAREARNLFKGLQTIEKLNPESMTNRAARDAAVEAAVRPHLREMQRIGKMTTGPEAALEANLPAGVKAQALADPAKAASLAQWMGVYARAERAKFSPQAKASLGLATRNLNNNLGTDLTLEGILGGQ